jgi:uncharacterized protein (DUF2461 family)
MPERDELIAIRNLLAEQHQDFERLLAGRTLRKSMGKLQGEQLSRVPKGYSKDHPAEDLIRRKQWFLESTLEGGAVMSNRMLAEIVGRFRAAAPMVEFLTQPFVKSSKPKKLPFMAF